MRSTLTCVILLLVFAGFSEAQYTSRRRGPVAATATSGPYNGPAVTFQGTLKAVTKKELIVDLDRAEPGEEPQSLTFRISHKTKFLKNDRETRSSEFTVGARVTVDATRDGDQKLSAIHVAMAPSPL